MRDLAHALGPGQGQVMDILPSLLLVFGALPLAWKAVVTNPPALSMADWIWDSTRPDLVFSKSLTAYVAYNINPSGTISITLPVPQPPVLSVCEPAHVWEWDASRPWHPASKRKHLASRAALYFGGKWGSLPVDHTVWGIGEKPAHEYIVRDAAERLCLLRQTRDRYSRLVPGTPLKPRIWEDDWEATTPAFGLRAIERRWLLSAESVNPAQQQPHLGPGETQYAHHTVANWMLPSPPRPPPRERGAGAPPLPRAPSAQGSFSTHPSFDTVDALAIPDNCPPAPWKRVWIQIQGVLQDRDQRGLAWRVLHGSVFCGAFRGYINNRIPYSDRCCPRPCCSNQPETLTHMFLTCPVAARVIRWVCDLWPAVTGGSRPVASAAVFLADDSRVWDPGTALRDLWTRIRLATLYNIWTAAQQRRRGVINNSASIVAKIIFNLRGSIYRDWQRTQEDVRMHATILSDWLRGRDPVISIAFFQDLWGPSGGLYTLIPPALPAGRPSMQIRLSCTVPIAVPLGGEHF